MTYGTCKPTGDVERDKRRRRDVIAATKIRRREAEEHQRRVRERPPYRAPASGGK